MASSSTKLKHQIIGTKPSVIDSSSKRHKYTYLVRTDYYPDSFIDGLFKARGNWIKVQDSDIPRLIREKRRIDFIYLDGLSYLKPLYYSLTSNLKNIVNDGKRVISFKNNLMSNLSVIPGAKQFLMPQIDIDLFTYTDPAEMAKFDERYAPLFYGDRVYIFKPVSGMGGSGIKIITTFEEFREYICKVIARYSKGWGKKPDANKEAMRIFVIQQYITEPLLVKHNGADYKFHVRHFYIYQPGNRPSYYKNMGKMALAEEPYIQGDWFNSRIHDTHFHAKDRWLFNCQDTGISQANMAKINKQIHEFYKILDKLVRPHAGCYPESRSCFELFGVDFMITQDYELKVLEVNAGLGLSDNMTENKAELFKGMLELVMDSYFPPVNKYLIQTVKSKFTEIIQ